MNTQREITYTLDFEVRRNRRNTKPAANGQPDSNLGSVPRISRLVALAIRMEGLVGKGAIRDYAAMSRLGWVTRARMTQIMKLLNLAPDILEQILFLPRSAGINERNLRPISNLIDWDQQRRLFQGLIGGKCGNRG